jgi:hypothetical protein
MRRKAEDYMMRVVDIRAVALDVDGVLGTSTRDRASGSRRLRRDAQWRERRRASLSNAELHAKA